MVTPYLPLTEVNCKVEIKAYKWRLLSTTLYPNHTLTKHLVLNHIKNLNYLLLEYKGNIHLEVKLVN